MGEQLSFGDADRANARTTDPITSHEAAFAAKLTLRESQEAVLLAASSFLLGFTDTELIKTYEAIARSGRVPFQSQSGIRTRRKELCDLGKVRDSGRQAQIGKRNHTVWEVVR